MHRYAEVGGSLRELIKSEGSYQRYPKDMHAACSRLLPEQLPYLVRQAGMTDRRVLPGDVSVSDSHKLVHIWPKDAPGAALQTSMVEFPSSYV